MAVFFTQCLNMTSASQDSVATCLMCGGTFGDINTYKHITLTYTHFICWLLVMLQLCVICYRQNPPCEIMNAFPPDTSGMIPKDWPIPAVSRMDSNIPQECSQLPELQQQDVYGNGEGERWPATGHDRREGSPNTSFQSHYSGYDEPSGSDRMMWHSQQNEEVRTQNTMLWYIDF